MSTKENFKFVSFEAALIACQMLVTHYAIVGYQVSVLIYKRCRCVECSIFHDAELTITPPTGFDYSSCRVQANLGSYRTSFKFKY